MPLYRRGPLVQDESIALARRPFLNFTGAGVTATDDAANNQTDVSIAGGGAAAISSAALDFTAGDTLKRFTITDAAVSAASKIVGVVRRPDSADDSADRGYVYAASVVRIGTGAFDLLVSVSDGGGFDPTAIPPSETATFYYLIG
jgi:hypothetical protein